MGFFDFFKFKQDCQHDYTIIKIIPLERKGTMIIWLSCKKCRQSTSTFHDLTENEMAIFRPPLIESLLKKEGYLKETTKSPFVTIDPQEFYNQLEPVMSLFDRLIITRQTSNGGMEITPLRDMMRIKFKTAYSHLARSEKDLEDLEKVIETFNRNPHLYDKKGKA